MTIKEAVGAAVTAFRDLFPKEATDVRLEEIDHAETDRAWKITISIANPDFDKEIEIQKKLISNPFGFPSSNGSTQKIDTRRYKSIILNSNNGELVSIKNV